MNFINNILDKLKKRGAKEPSVEAAPPGDPAIEAAHVPKNRIKVSLTALISVAVLAAAGAGGWYWWSLQSKTTAPKVAQAPTKPISAPAALPAVVPNVASGVVATQPVAESQPVAAVTQEAVPKESVPKEHEQKESLPKEVVPETETATLSPPELAAPAPAKAHDKQPAAASRQKHKNTARIHAPDTQSELRDDESGSAPVAEGSVDKKIKPLSLQQQADNEFRRANGLMQQGRIDEALAGYETALQLDADHDAARQALVVLLLQNNRNADAESVLQEGLKHNIKHSGFAMLLARIQLDRDAAWSALLTLQKTLPYAERQADYQAFVAALLQRLNRHKEAVTHYQVAVQLSPNSGVWWMGMGISLQALQRNEEARGVFKRALETNTLNADLKSYVTQQMKRL